MQETGENALKRIQLHRIIQAENQLPSTRLIPFVLLQVIAQIQSFFREPAINQ